MMHFSLLSNSMNASAHVRMVKVTEPVSDGNGIYVGKTQVYKMPFFLEQGRLLNPHLAALGMTGSGKTYFLKGYIIRSVLSNDSKLFVLDWTGEYSETISLLSGHEQAPESCSFGLDTDAMLNGIFSINLLHLRSDSERKDAANRIINAIIEKMHNMPISTRQNRIILLDEAWKMLGDTKGLGQLFREGRKFGFSVLIATQLAKDISNEIISNTAALFIFRLQNNDDYSMLMDSGIIDEEQKTALSTLPIGSCMVRLATKEEQISSFMIKKVAGIATTVYTIKGDNMQIKVSSSQFLKSTESVFDRAICAKISAFMEANERNADISGLIRLLLVQKAKRSDIVTYLRLLGFNDLTAVSAYEKAKSQLLVE